jgi:signal transduction histidine kinase
LAYRNSPKICIDVADNGIGIPEEKWETIFQKGYSENGSTGLGLALARETLQKYGGRIFVKQSNANEGTTFTIELNEVP